MWIACAICTCFALSSAAAINPYSGAKHALTDADTWGKRKEYLTITNNSGETIEIKATVRLYVKNKYASGDYLNGYKLSNKKKKSIETSKLKNTSYGKYNYYIVSNSGDTWGDSDIDW